MLPYSEIPAEHLAIGDLASPLGDEIGLMNVHLATWMARDGSQPGDAADRAGEQVLGAIDVMLYRLHLVRDRMATEYRERQEAAAARAGRESGR